jgi:hypothetical protein
MAGKPRLLLLDAGAVFAAMRAEAWDALVDAYEIVVPATVVRVEAVFYTSREGRRVAIDLRDEAVAGRISEVEMTAAEIDRVRLRFTPDFRERLDPGELEAIAYLLANPEGDIRFVSGDGPAIQAAVMLDDDRRVLALAEALALCGYSKKLPHQYSHEFVQRHAKEGAMRRIQGRGLTS